LSVGQSIEALDPATSQDLAAKREWVTGHYDAQSLDKYQTLTGKLDLLATILAEGWVKRADQLKLQSLGVGFGDAIAQDTLMEWVVVDDEYGRSAALNWPGTTCYAFR